MSEQPRDSGPRLATVKLTARGEDFRIVAESDGAKPGRFGVTQTSHSGLNQGRVAVKPARGTAQGADFSQRLPGPPPEQAFAG